jgi:hypothetical protein
MATQTIVFFAYLAIASPIIWWLMWREGFEGMQSEWRYNRERKTRRFLSPRQFYDQFYKSSGVKKETLYRLLALHAEVWKVEAELIRPHDNYPRIFDGLEDVGEFVRRIQSEFGFTIPEEDYPTIDGSFDSLARYVDARLSKLR